MSDDLSSTYFPQYGAAAPENSTKSHKWLWIGGAVLAASVAGVVIWLITNKKKKPAGCPTGQSCQAAPCSLTWEKMNYGTTPPVDPFMPSGKASSLAICRVLRDEHILYGRVYRKGDDGAYACSVGFAGVETPAVPFEYLRRNGSDCATFKL